MTPVMEMRDGAVELAGRPVLRGIDLVVGHGEAVVLLGANGSGKSTLVRSLLGLIPASRGEVRLFDAPVGRFRDWRRVGFVPQRAVATSGVPATVREVVTSGRLARRTPFLPVGRADRAAVAEAIEAVGLADRAGEGVAALSGGQQQRVLIARALAGQPELLVLDEPTAGVDLESQRAFAEVLARAVSRGATLMLVAHEMGPLAGLVERTVVLREGRVIHDGAPLTSFTEAGAVHHHYEDHGSGAEGHAGHDPHVPRFAGPLDPRQLRNGA